MTHAKHTHFFKRIFSHLLIVATITLGVVCYAIFNDDTIVSVHAQSSTNDGYQSSSIALNGSCGSTTNTCYAGTPSNYNNNLACGTSKTWSCLGSNGGSTASCSIANAACSVNESCSTQVIYTSSDGDCGGNAPEGPGISCAVVPGACTCRETTCTSPVNGVCGSTHGTTVSFTPTVNLCSVGTATTVLGSGPYFWSCVGTDGGSTASCNALYQNSCTAYTGTNYTNNITRQTNEISAKLGTIEGETATPFTVTDSILQSDYNKLTLIGNILNSTNRLIVRIKNLNTDTQMIQYKNEATQNFYGCNAALWPVSLRGIVSDDLSDQSDAKIAQIIAGGGFFGGGLSYFNAFITSIQRVVNIFSPTERFFARETPAGFSVSCMVCTPPTTTVVGNLCTTQPNHPDCWLNGAGWGRTAQSFIKGTTVTMADGSLQAVENIQLGDKVKTSGGRGTIIKKHIYNTTANIYRMNTNHYFVTASHPFRTTEGWKSFDPETTRIKVPSIETNLLQSGDILIKENGDYEILTNTDYLTGLHTVYNFSVDSTHDFYANGYRVHNK